jgi:hypothetical protein
MRTAWFLALLPFVASFGCTEQTRYESYQIDATGPTMRVATGESANVSVGISSTQHEDYGGCGAGPVLPSLTVDDVTCSPSCTVSSMGPQTFAVSSRTPGVASVRLATSTSDGTRHVSEVSIQFRDVTQITAVRDARSPSGTAYPMVKGDAQQWQLAAGDAEGPLRINPCHLNVSGADAIEGSRECTTSGDATGAAVVTVRAASAGRGTLKTEYGALVRMDRITVIDPQQVRRAELREVGLAGMLPVESGASILITPARDPLVLRFNCAEEKSPLVVARLETEDGTVALGGTIALYTEPANALDLGLINQVGKVSMRQPFDGMLRGAYGTNGEVAMSARYIVRSGCPSIDDEPDASSDAGVEDGGGDAADGDASADAGVEDGGR